jgi:hypothetical protein
MQTRTLQITRDAAEPGLLLRFYAQVAVSWDAHRGNWCWTLLNAAGRPCRPATGPFEAAAAAFDAAQAELGGIWEEEEASPL